MIITVSREFGSGGREIGKRLADELKIPYYDREIVEQVALKGGYSQEYVENASEQGLSAFPLTFGHSFYFYSATTVTRCEMLVKQQEIIKELAEKGDCVIVGRCASYVLQDKKPFNIFVYASNESKIKRCREREENNENEKNLTDKELLKKIKCVDAGRRRLVEMISGKDWGDKNNYSMMLNTTVADIKSLSKCVASYIKTLNG